MAVLVKTYRGTVEDLVHHGHIAVTDEEGKLLFSWGDPNRVVFARSSAKPIQAIQVAESGALEGYNISEKELAVICSSHNAEQFHIDTIRSILKKASIGESALQCGAHYPMYLKDEVRMRYEKVTPTNIYSDCSGKHAGMLISAKIRGESLEDYYKADSPTQKRNLQILSEFCDIDKKDIQLALDGCGVPVHAMPLYKFAQGYARLSRPSSLEILHHKEAAEKITVAMTAYPEMVAGTDRLCTDLMKNFGDRLFSKSGAGAYYAVGIKEKGIGIAIKMEEGTSHLVGLVVLSVLKQLKIITDDEYNKMTTYTDCNIYNFKHEIVGRIEAVFHL